MMNIYSPANLMEGQCLKDMLEGRGIHCHLSGVHLTGAVGELPAIGLLGLYVTEDDGSIARQLIDEYLSADPLLEGRD